MRATLEQIEGEWLSLVSEGDTAAELHERHRCDRSVATISKHLKSLHEQGLLGRRWRGNERFGCWEYTPHRGDPRYSWID